MSTLIFLSTLLLTSATLAGKTTEERMFKALDVVTSEEEFGVQALDGFEEEFAIRHGEVRRRKTTAQWNVAATYMNVVICQGGMTVSGLIATIKEALDADLTTGATPKWDCEQDKNDFFKYIESTCQLQNALGKTFTIYAGRTYEAAVLGGMTRTDGAYLDSDGNTGCFTTIGGSGGVQINSFTSGHSVGVVFGGQHDLEGWSAGVGSEVAVGPGFDLNGGMTIPGKVPYVESGYVGGIALNIVSFYLCRTWIYQDAVSQSKFALVKKWANINKETGRSWQIGGCQQTGGTRISMSKGSSLNHMVYCLQQCKSYPNSQACELVVEKYGPWWGPKYPGCYVYTLPVTTTMYTTKSMCYMGINHCTDTPNFSNFYGHGCASYASQWCFNGHAQPGKEWALGSQYNNPEEHCCVCGGGTTDYSCADDVDWKDSSGHKCQKYEQNSWCKDGKQSWGWNGAWGSIYSYKVNGISAHQACCACGKQ